MSHDSGERRVSLRDSHLDIRLRTTGRRPVVLLQTLRPWPDEAPFTPAEIVLSIHAARTLQQHLADLLAEHDAATGRHEPTDTERLAAVREAFGPAWDSLPRRWDMPEEVIALMSAIFDRVPGVDDEDEYDDDEDDEGQPAVAGVSVDAAGRVEPLVDFGGAYVLGGPR